MIKLTTVASYSFPHEAQIARAGLERAGIPAEVADEYTINMQWLYSLAIGGVKVKVPTELTQEALEVLNTDYSAAVEKKFNIESDKCPECKSTRLIAHTRGKRPAFIVFLLFGFPLFFFQHGIKCNECNHFWKT